MHNMVISLNKQVQRTPHSVPWRRNFLLTNGFREAPVFLRAGFDSFLETVEASLYFPVCTLEVRVQCPVILPEV